MKDMPSCDSDWFVSGKLERKKIYLPDVNDCCDDDVVSENAVYDGGMALILKNALGQGQRHHFN